MNNYQLKSENSIAAGEMLKDAGNYDNSIHCFYYACVQIMTLIKESDPTIQRNFNNNMSSGVHQQLITSISPDLNRKSIVDFLQFNNEVHILRNLRVKGDYQKPFVSASEANDAALYSENIINLLKRNYLI